MGLFDFLNKLQVVKEINGSIGERLAKFFAEAMTDALVLHDVLIDGANGYTSQIDLVLVGKKGVYVVEMKMFADAKIYGNTKSSKWSYYKYGKKYEIYNPLKQNKKHVEYLKRFLKNFGEVPCFSIITMVCDDFKISGENGENTVICSSLLAMERAIHKISENKPIVFDDAKKKEIYDYIQNNQHIGKDARKEHKQNVIAYKENLEQMKKQKLCPYCTAPLVLRKGKYGEFYGCSNYPKCKYTLKEK